MKDGNDQRQPSQSVQLVTLETRGERKHIRSSGDERALVFHIRVGAAPQQAKNTRPPLRLALVLDRSGSMQGEKLTLAKQATLAVLDQLTDRDTVAIVAFDDRIDIVQAAERVTPALKQRARAALEEIQARSSTALHEGWLTGCNAIVSDSPVAGTDTLGRCFLLTDGIANIGLTDPEQIAGEAAGVREHTGISTSTFGIGQDYNELLLGPLAVAGGGQFHHLRNPQEIFQTFVGELGELLSVAARQVRLELELETGLTMEVISAYWQEKTRNSLAIGDLQYSDEQHVVIRVRFPAQWSSEKRTVRARLVWLEGKDERQTEWQETYFTYADEAICATEQSDQDVVYHASLQEADRARREAIARNNCGDVAGARDVLQRVSQQVASAAPANPLLQAEVASLNSLQSQMARAPLAPGMAKEEYYQQQRRSRNKEDYRNAEPKKPEQK
jgi:hypothetical protein